MCGIIVFCHGFRKGVGEKISQDVCSTSHNTSYVGFRRWGGRGSQNTLLVSIVMNLYLGIIMTANVLTLEYIVCIIYVPCLLSFYRVLHLDRLHSKFSSLTSSTNLSECVTLTMQTLSYDNASIEVMQGALTFLGHVCDNLSG